MPLTFGLSFWVPGPRPMDCRSSTDPDSQGVPATASVDITKGAVFRRSQRREQAFQALTHEELGINPAYRGDSDFMLANCPLDTQT
jgi:hypothetical protein